MRPVDSVFISYCAANEALIMPKRKDILDRIKNCSDSVFKWIRENPYIILSASGLALGAVALATETLALLPAAAYIIVLGIIFHQTAKSKARHQLETRLLYQQIAQNRAEIQRLEALIERCAQFFHLA